MKPQQYAPISTMSNLSDQEEHHQELHHDVHEDTVVNNNTSRRRPQELSNSEKKRRADMIVKHQKEMYEDIQKRNSQHSKKKETVAAFASAVDDNSTEWTHIHVEHEEIFRMMSKDKKAGRRRRMQADPSGKPSPEEATAPAQEEITFESLAGEQQAIWEDIQRKRQCPAEESGAGTAASSLRIEDAQVQHSSCTLPTPTTDSYSHDILEQDSKQGRGIPGSTYPPTRISRSESFGRSRRRKSLERTKKEVDQLVPMTKVDQKEVIYQMVQELRTCYCGMASS